MVRNEIVVYLIQSIEKSNTSFIEYDFSFETLTAKGQPSIIIKYRYKENYFFKANLPTNKTEVKGPYSSSFEYIIDGDMHPGGMCETESFTCIGRDGLVRQIFEWLNHLESELTSLPVKRALENQAAEISRLEGIFEQSKDEYMSQLEAETFRLKLDQLEKQFKEHLTSSIEGDKDLKAQIKQLHSEIQTLKASMEYLTKQNWLKSALARMLKWSANPVNAELLKSGASAMKTFLLSEGDSSAVTDATNVVEAATSQTASLSDEA